MTDHTKPKPRDETSTELAPGARNYRSGVGLAVALIAYIGAVVTANVVTARMGLVPVGFGLLVPAGTYAAGAALLARDFVHRHGGRRWALGAIGVAAILSWFMSTPEIAIASVAAFLIAELVDLVIFSAVRRRGFIRAALTSNLVSAPLDTIVFLVLAGFPLTVDTVLGQMVGKLLWATALPLAVYALVRWIRERRQAV
ncbi:VUT family protein [Krasilnikoviella flava]|uniref:Queuosine precursor transporter n=1 Tax=Krasilnikoviella flava TaxID=526729 RepID=A0A1T5KRP0_9MICO|nr:VUT family protein [Krasilnikoviella flava]SKC66330.1 hypothetical protein SAMN04324258_2316 [Krasilnikoviella flava]